MSEPSTEIPTVGNGATEIPSVGNGAKMIGVGLLGAGLGMLLSVLGTGLQGAQLSAQVRQAVALEQLVERCAP